jgi:pyruvate dehydrogenase E1 component
MQKATSISRAAFNHSSAPSLDLNAAPSLDALEQIQRRVLWLATRIIHEANSVRPNNDGTKVGGHQASSASMVTIMTALYFHFLREGDRVSVKPHASPVLHAINYLLGQLPQSYLTTLRAFGGLQAYPSRTKDPDPIDFSTGSVGLGAVAPTFAALAHHYARTHFEGVAPRRFVSLIGDAELDEGNIWEAIIDPALDGIENVLWIVDLNRQSLDRVVPGVRVAKLKQLFATANWQVLEAKYGRTLQSLMAQPHGQLLRQRIDEMGNEEYQTLIRLPGAQIRPRLTQLHGAPNADLAALIATIDDAMLPSVLSNLGGHDFEELLTVLAQAEREPKRPTVLFAYTIKGWGLPIAGHPLNHSMLLNDAQIETLRQTLGIAPEAIWDAFDSDTPEGRLCAAAANRLYPTPKRQPALLAPTAIPEKLGLPSTGTTSTQEAFGRVLVRLADLPELRQWLVTAAPDVAISTNLAGWINKTGVFSSLEEPEYEGEGQMLMRWRRGPSGQHIELGISEMNLFMLLGMFGLSAEINGQHLIPIGAVYDPFICRGLDALIYGLYSGAKFIFVGTPSGITLSPEGGAHQSTITASIGMELPNLHAYEPCFSCEVEWIMLEALRECCDRLQGRSTYLRLSTRPIEQALINPVQERIGVAALRQQVIDGGYRLIEGRAATDGDAPVVQIAVSGALVPEAVAAARYLQREGIAANVLNLTSPRRLYERWQAARRADNSSAALDWLILSGERHAPIITVHDASSHALAWLGSVHGAPVSALGVDRFGQSGARNDLYHYAGIDSESIIEAAFAVVDQFTS